MRGVYFEIGRIIKIAQYIEYNLAELIEKLKLLRLLHANINVPSDKLNQVRQEAKDFREKLVRRTLGNIIKYIEDFEVIPKEQIDELRYVLDVRNDLIHQYFKRKDFEKHSENYEFLIIEKNFLTKFYNRANRLNDYIYKVVNEKIEEYNKLIKLRATKNG